MPEGMCGMTQLFMADGGGVEDSDEEKRDGRMKWCGMVLAAMFVIKVLSTDGWYEISM